MAEIPADRCPHDHAVDQRAAVLRALSPVLDAVGRMNASADLATSLQSVIEGIIQAIGFGAGAIDYVRTDGTMEIVAVAGPPGARESLLGKEVPVGALDRELALAEHWGRLRFLPHGTVANDVPYVWTPDIPLPRTPDGWHPDDCLLAPLYAGPDELIGVLSVDMPVNGKRPDAFQRQLLELLAGQAETALQNARRASRLRASEESFRLAFEATAVGMGMISLDHSRPLHLLRSNRALDRIAEAAGREPVAVLSDLLDPADPDHDPGCWSRAIRSAPAGVYRAEKQLRAGPDEQGRAGERPWVQVVATVLPLHSTETGQAIVQVEDITERRHRAASDPLTGLANRTRLDDGITAALEAVRTGAPPGALLFCDLDDFKSINDVFGHLAGDAVLRACAGRLAAEVRTGDNVFRMGGDEFALVLYAVGPEELARLVARIKRVVAEPIDHEGRRLAVTISVGPAVIDGAVGSVDGLLAAADAAMYADKRFNQQQPKDGRST